MNNDLLRFAFSFLGFFSQGKRAGTKFGRYKKNPEKFRRLLLTAALSLLLLLFGWLAESLYHVQLPDSEHPVELYATELNDDLGLVMCRAIENAKESVTLLIYTLTDKKIISCLRKKSEEGAVVKVICDAKTSPRIEERLGPQVKILRRYINDLMHIKMLIIDTTQTWIGSANMTGESLRHYGNLVAAINSKPLAEMADAKARSFTDTGRLMQLTHRRFPLGKQEVEMWFLPDDPMAVKRIKDLIRGARHSIKIAMFTWTRFDLAEEIIRAKRHGINVQIVLDRNGAFGSGSAVTEKFTQAKINVSLNRGNELLHHKFMIVDDEILINGSANWTGAAFSKNDDCFFVLYPLLPEQQQKLKQIWSVIQSESEGAVNSFS